MNTKAIVFMASLLAISGLGAAQNAPLTDFEFEPGNGFEADLSGGAEYSLQASFENLAGKDLPLVVNVTVSSSGGMNPEGKEFDFDAVLESDNGDEFRDTEMDCSHQGLVDEETSYFSCTSESLEVLSRSQSQPSENDLELTADVTDNIAPGSYSFQVDIMSQVGIPAASEEQEVEAKNPQPVEVEGDSSSAEVEVNPESDANVTVQVYEEVSTEPPEPDRELVSGVDVEVSDKEGSVKANGTVTIEYDQSVVSSNGLNEEEMDVYYYDERDREWASEDTVIANHDLAENTITAEVPHFSVYAAYAEEEQPEDDSGGDTIVIEDDGGQQQEEPESNETEQPPEPPTGGEDETNEDDGGDDTEQDTGQSEETGTGAEETPGTQGRGPTAAFVRSPTGGAVALITVLLVLAGLIYRYRGEKIRAFIRGLK